MSLPEGFLLRVVVSYFLVLGCRFAYLSLYLGFWTGSRDLILAYIVA